MDSEDEFHHELLESAEKRFPVESFLLMRREGLSVPESLEALGYRETDLSFQLRAVLALPLEDEQAIRALLS